MNLINLKNISLSLISLSALIMVTVYIISLLSRPVIVPTNLPSINDIKFDAVYDTAVDQKSNSFPESNFDYELIGYRSGGNDSSVILKKGNKEFVLKKGDKLDNMYQLIEVTQEEITFLNQGKLFKIKNSVGK